MRASAEFPAFSSFSFFLSISANAWNLERVKVVPLLFDPSFVVNDRAEMSREMEQSVIKSGSSNFVEIIGDVRKNLERSSLERELVRSCWEARTVRGRVYGFSARCNTYRGVESGERAE